MSAYDAVIFDLDGTLLNTLEDLADSVNFALEQNDFPTRSLSEIRQFVGNGVGKLVARSVPDGTDEALKAKCLAEFQAHYLTNMRHKTAPYPGILTLLGDLKNAGVRIAVASNKFEGAVKALCPEYFGDLVDFAAGEGPDTRKKPAPDMVLRALDELGVDRARAIYVGDSDVDLETAQNAGVDCISVTWGFRDGDFLCAHGAKRMTHTVEELGCLLLGSAVTAYEN